MRDNETLEEFGGIMNKNQIDVNKRKGSKFPGASV